LSQPYEKRAGSTKFVPDLLLDGALFRRVEVDAVRELILGYFSVAVAAQPSRERVVCDPAKKVVVLKEAPIHLDQCAAAAMVAAQKASRVLAKVALAA
jgi:hypothetical protein